MLAANVPRRPHPQRTRILFNRLLGRLVGRPLNRAWRDTLAHYRARGVGFPPVRTLRIPNVNDAGTLALLEETKPGLVLVSSTTLVGRNIIHWAEQRMGILNLHTGLSPYVNGGPNCTNWCLAQKWFHLIGNTVHWLDTGIDSGPIVTTGRPALLGSESLASLQVKVHDHGHELFARVLTTLSRGVQVPKVPQISVGTGRTFWTVEWSPLAMARASMNHRRHFRPEWFKSDEFAHASSMVREVPL